ncbi:TPA: hypothetical protein JD323_003864, partial [Citrobacter amalonaticus]|nr:hypothetical protein [Citrobacter amalonaticus]HDQ2813326.1 hypothetical protein [Citrobacter amalonaticus]
MNKIYRLVWDQAKGMLIPVSELTTVKGKRGSLCGSVSASGEKKRFRLKTIVVVVFFGLGVVPEALAYLAGNNNTLVVDGAPVGMPSDLNVIGDNNQFISDTSAGDNKLRLNNYIIVMGAGNLIERTSEANVANNAGVGSPHLAPGLMFGTKNKNIDSGDVNIFGYSNSAIGSNGNPVTYSNILGTSNHMLTSSDRVSISNILGYSNTIDSSDYAVIVGGQSLINSSDNSVVIGNDSSIVNAPNSVVLGGSSSVSASGAMSIGVGSQSDYIDSVALGRGSKTDAIIQTPTITIRGDTYTMAGGNPNSTVSIGDKDIDMTRTITGLAAGRVSGTSTDAINGSQLYAFQNAMDKLALDNSFHFLDNAGDGVSVTNGGTLQFKSQNSNIAIDQKGVADAGIMDITLSNDLDLTAAGSLTIGNSLLNNNGLTITGGPSITTGGIDAGGKTITNVAPGVNGTDAVNVDQLNAVDAVANAGWNVADADGNTHNVKPGDTATFASADSNVTVTQKDGTVTVDLADSLDLGATGSVTMGDTTVNNGGLT